MDNQILRCELYYANLNPVLGSEQGGIRPVLILQNDNGNQHSPTVIVVAITGKPKKINQLTHYAIPAIQGLSVPSMVLLEQIRTIDKGRLQTYIGMLDETTMEGIDHALAVSLGLKTICAIT